jgi:DnaJ-class molecular chaperone
MTMTEVIEVTICDACNGNGFLRVPHPIYADQFEVDQCRACRSSGEVQVSNEEPEDRR